MLQYAMKIPEIIKKISKRVQLNGAKAIIVGGSVRDHFLGLPIKDYDIEVYGLPSLEALSKILEVYGSVNFVGKSFGVLKFVHEGVTYDFSFPRTEQKVGIGHRGFEVTCDGGISFELAARRRDFTINAMGYDIESKVFLDPYGGREDIRQQRLRHIDADRFVEDPLRVYRAVQFVARFGYLLDEETHRLCRWMVDEGMLESLPKERIYEEFKKLLLRAPRPSVGFELMRSLGILQYYPELKNLIGVPQSKKWHPEGDVWIHTMMAVDEMVKLQTGEEKQDLKMMLAILCHDLGKATHTQIRPDRISAIGHAKAGVPLSRRFLGRFTEDQGLTQGILPLVEHHLAPTTYYRTGANDSTIRKLATKVNIQELVTVARADFLGRTTKMAQQGIYEAGDWLLKKAEELGVLTRPLRPFIQGRDLIALGLRPSKAFREILEELYRAQLHGEVCTKQEALARLKNVTMEA